MASILADEPATFIADPEFVDKANGYVVGADDWNELLAAHRDMNSWLHEGAAAAVRLADLRVGSTTNASPDIQLEKSNAGTARLRFLSNAVLRWQFICNSSEQLSLECYDGAAALVVTPFLFDTDGSVYVTGNPVVVQGLTPNDGDGAAAFIFGGAGSGTDRDGGDVAIVAGSSTGTGAPGEVRLEANGGVSHVVVGHDGSENTLGFFGASPVGQQAAGSAASDPATTQALANALRTALMNLGLIG